MSAVRFTFNTSGLRKKLAGLAKIKAGDFRAELMEFVRKSLTTASRNTPARDYSLIRRNQLRQYEARVNCIPSSHELTDPSLRIRGNQHWLFFRGKWLNAKEWRISDEAFAAYASLLAEHERRKQTAQATFIKDRAQARFLYRRSWTQAADDLGVTLNVAQSTRASRSRHNPPKAPTKATGRIVGNASALSVRITNEFLEEPSRYKDFTGKPILAAAMNSHRDAYNRSVKRRMTQITKAAK
jgi:hypothetical protein